MTELSAAKPSLAQLPAVAPPRATQIINPHAVLTGLIGVIVVVSVGMLILNLISLNGPAIALSVVGLLCFVGLLAAHLRGWRYSSHATVFAAMLFTVLGNPAELTTRQLSFTVFIPSVLAAMFLPWYWTVGAFAVCVLGIGGQTGFTGPLFRPDVLLLAVIVVAGTAAAGAFGRSAQRAAEERANLLADEKQRVEAQAAELVDANSLLEMQLDQQKKLLDLVASLETPAVQIAEGVLLVPLIGHVDSRRAQELTQKLLVTIQTQRARHIILDVAGVSLMDTGVAQAILSTTRAIRLLGCNAIMSGISANMALTLTHLGVPLGEMQSVRSPQEALLTITEARKERRN